MEPFWRFKGNSGWQVNRGLNKGVLKLRGLK